MIVIKIYDCEVFAHDWLVVIADVVDNDLVYHHFWNDNVAALKEYLEQFPDLYTGYNNKHYDYFMVKGMCAGFTPEEVKACNDYIIGGGQGWNYEPFEGLGYFDIPQCDLSDDVQIGLSLKAIEGHMGLDIRECSVPFDIDRPLNAKERAEVLDYCKTDVRNTFKLLKLRVDYLKTKQEVGAIANIDPQKALSLTNAKLTAKVLKAVKKEHNDERKYVYPDNLLKEYIPSEVFEFFDRLHDESISDADVFSQNLVISLGDCDITIGFGGIHGAKVNYIWQENSDRIMRNFDVMGYYPHIMVYYGYCSRNMPSPKTFEDIVAIRDEAKINHDKKKAVPYKLVTNTAYGAMLNEYNDLYDPLMGRSTCITGQLFLLELANRLYTEIPDLSIVQVNTDGVAVEFDEAYYDKVMEILAEWQQRTRFTLEEDKIAYIAQKDVNNYIVRYENGEVKSKGGYLVRGISTAGAFKINNNARIVAKALMEYFLNGTPPEATINACNDPFEFQIIAKASHKYNQVFQVVCDKEEPVQRCNRVYAVTNENYGTLYKVKTENGQIAKIADLPEHCVVDNSASIYIEMIDKSYYIEKAYKQINDFKGDYMAAKKDTTEKEEVVVTKTDNVYARLLKARVLFAKECVKKSGKNFNIGYHYFELSDIVPIAIPVFEKVGIIPIVTFNNYMASMIVVNIDNPDDIIEFTSPMKELEPIITKTGKEANNAIQRMGSAETYQRRYLYMMALDIVENDQIEEATGEEEPAKKPKPVSTEQRKETKAALTNADDNASELQITQLKKTFKKLIEKDEEYKVQLTDVALETENFTKMSKQYCEDKIKWATNILNGGDGNESDNDNTTEKA